MFFTYKILCLSLIVVRNVNPKYLLKNIKTEVNSSPSKFKNSLSWELFINLLKKIIFKYRQTLDLKFCKNRSTVFSCSLNIFKSLKKTN